MIRSEMQNCFCLLNDIIFEDLYVDYQENIS